MQLYAVLRNTKKLHVQVQVQVHVFLRLDTWMFETCRKHYIYAVVFITV